MRRPTLSTKMIAAALPLVLAVVALLGITVRSDLNEISSVESGAELGGVWAPLITAMTSIEAELAETSAESGSAPTAATRRATDQAVNDLHDKVETIGAAEAAGAHITASRSSLSAARRNLDMAIVAPDLQTEIDPFEAYAVAGRELVAVGQLLPSEAGDPELGRELLAVVKLAEAKLSANDIISATQTWQADPSNTASLATARSAFTEMEATLREFETIAPDEWATQYRQSGFPSELTQFRGDLDSAARSTETGLTATFDAAAFTDLVNRGVQFQSSISQEIVDRSSLEVDATRRTTLIRIGISLGAVLFATFIALFMSRSITRRVKAVSASANQVATEQLPALVEALRDPRGKAVLPDIQPVDARGSDELAELAGAFNSMQNTLVDVANEQVEVLRRGVSHIFVTMARRNRSLIDRQLAMLDEFEAEVDDPAVLGNYYQLDHLATRMRRNSESLLVLASAEPKRRRVKATEIDDVVRASIGEVEDYRRVDIENLESLQVRGTVVADVSHLIAELLDNATAFSPPESPVRVGGRRSGDSYLLRIVDSGIGIPTERLGELNQLLREPPAVGLSVESTLGMSVVSLLANKHGITVTLAPGNPGLMVDISLPSTLFGPIDVPIPATSATPIADLAADEQIVAWNDSTIDSDLRVDESFAPAAGFDAGRPAEPAPAQSPATVRADADQSHVATADWDRMSRSLSAFHSGQQLAQTAQTDSNPAQDADPTLEPASEQFVPAEPTAEPTAEPIQELVPEPTPTPLVVRQVAQPDVEAPLATPPATSPLPDLPPPPTIITLPGEFDHPLAPPISADGPSRGPVTPATARPAPARPPVVPGSGPPNLPTRSRAAAPDGPDRLVDVYTPGEQIPASSPGALQAALSAFDIGRHGTNGTNGTNGSLDVIDATPAAAPSNGSLPIRTRVDDPVPHIDEPTAATTSRLDPEALRERLRAFQTEFRSAGSDNPASIAAPGTNSDHNSDLGGDLR